MISSLEPVPWLTRGQIALQAEGLLEAYWKSAGRKPEFPLPIEALVERHLGLRLEYDDLEDLLGEPDILGATWVEEKRLVIDQGLLEGPEGRFAFTCAHEAGHWVIHRPLLVPFFLRSAGRRNHQPAIVCRKKEAGLRSEWQADYFAACLLMPARPVREAFENCFGTGPLLIHNENSFLSPKARKILSIFEPTRDSLKEIAGAVIRAGGFHNCSREAMGYRLEDLGLLLDHTGVQTRRG